MAEAADQPNNSAVKTRAICRELFAFTSIKIVVNLLGTRPLCSYLIVPMMWRVTFQPTIYRERACQNTVLFYRCREGLTLWIRTFLIGGCVRDTDIALENFGSRRKYHAICLITLVL
jgi:hypothetical protein